MFISSVVFGYLVLFRRIVLNLIVVAEARIVLKMFLFLVKNRGSLFLQNGFYKISVYVYFVSQLSPTCHNLLLAYLGSLSE